MIPQAAGKLSKEGPRRKNCRRLLSESALPVRNDSD